MNNYSSALRILGWILLFGLLTGLLSCLVGYGIAAKWFVPWSTLPPLPESAELIAGATVDSVDIQTVTGRIWRCEVSRIEDCWTPVDAPLTETDERCEPYDHAGPLGRVVERRLVCQNYADGGVTAVYALRENGRVYAWNAADSAYEALLIFICPAVGAPLGLAAGLVFGLLRNRSALRKTAGQ